MILEYFREFLFLEGGGGRDVIYESSVASEAASQKHQDFQSTKLYIFAFCLISDQLFILFSMALFAATSPRPSHHLPFQLNQIILVFFFSFNVAVKNACSGQSHFQ